MVTDDTDGRGPVRYPDVRSRATTPRPNLPSPLTQLPVSPALNTPSSAPTDPRPRTSFDAFMARVKGRTERALADYLTAEEARRAELGPAVAEVLAAVRSLATRGGKRFRAVLAACAYEGAGGDPTAFDGALVALELLQVYFLVHDDWMDGDLVRRGGPTVHAMLRERRSEKLGDAAAILAGDWACAAAQEALATVRVSPDRSAEAARAFARMQSDVVCGQILDVFAESLTEAAVERMHALKTGAYTVRGPLELGAALAGATPEHARALVAFAEPLGVAFQLRDDLLGTFGDPAVTGKPRYGDLAQKKRTCVVVSALASDARAEVERLLSLDAPSEDDAARAARAIEAAGVRGAIERRLASLLADARGRLAAVPTSREARDVLEGAVLALGERAS